MHLSEMPVVLLVVSLVV